MMKGVDVALLFESKIFQHTFDFDEWPGTHKDHNTFLLPYNGSVFDLRENYHIVGDKLSSKKSEEFSASKMHKVKYTLLLITHSECIARNPSKVSPSFMKMISDSEELAIFQSKLISDTIMFKWDQYAKNMHYRGFFMHLINISTLTVFVK